MNILVCLMLTGARLFSFSANHLWFIEFLIVFMTLAVPLKKGLHSRFGARLIGRLERLAAAKHGLFSLVVLVIVLRLSLKFYLPSQSHSIDNLSVSLFFSAVLCDWHVVYQQ